MIEKPILVVDDEKNIRLTLVEALSSLQTEIDTAINGEEALAKLKEKDFSLILLDLKMPGMDGMEVLRKLRKIRPDIKVIIITAYGTIDSAVEAMKLGAVDFIQKPFVPKEIRALASRVIDREKLDEQQAKDYATYIELSKKSIGKRHFDAAIEHVKKAISLDPSRPEAFNLLGILKEIHGDYHEALEHYRAALSLDPTYEAAKRNLTRITQSKHEESIVLGEIKKPTKK